MVNRARRECGCVTRGSQAGTTYSKFSCRPATSPAATWAAPIRVEATSSSTSATNRPPTQGIGWSGRPRGLITPPRGGEPAEVLKGTCYERTQSQLAKVPGQLGSGVAVLRRNRDGRVQRPDLSTAGRLGHRGDAAIGPGHLHQSACRSLVSAVHH